MMHDFGLNMQASNFEVRTAASWPNYSKRAKIGLDHFDFFQMMRPVYDAAFSLASNQSAFKRTGYAPFTSCVYWELRGSEEHSLALVSKRKAKAEAIGTLTEDAMQTFTSFALAGVRPAMAAAAALGKSVQDDTPADAPMTEEQQQRKKRKLGHCSRLTAAIEGDNPDTANHEYKKLGKEMNPASQKGWKIETSSDLYKKGPVTLTKIKNNVIQQHSLKDAHEKAAAEKKQKTLDTKAANHNLAVVAGTDLLKKFEDQLPGHSVAEIMAHAETYRSAPTPTNSKGPKLTGPDMKQMIVALNGTPVAASKSGIIAEFAGLLRSARGH
jgi:hypothetical protein